jgi:cysteine dioxygenase
MSTGVSHLNLDEFMTEMGREPVSSLTHKRLMDLVHRLRLSDELIESHTCFAEHQYARNLVCRTPAFELLVLCWKPGHESTIHDHAGSLNAISVFRGELTSRVFRPVDGRHVGAGPVEMTGEERVRPGQGWIGVDRGGIHQLANTGAADLITVHVYAPALMELTVYSTESPEIERRPLRYTLAEDLA